MKSVDLSVTERNAAREDIFEISDDDSSGGPPPYTVLVRRVDHFWVNLPETMMDTASLSSVSESSSDDSASEASVDPEETEKAGRNATGPYCVHQTRQSESVSELGVNLEHAMAARANTITERYEI